jgi:hypothetical protein
VVEAAVQREQLGVDENTFAVYAALKPNVSDLRAAQASALKALNERLAGGPLQGPDPAGRQGPDDRRGEHVAELQCV